MRDKILDLLGLAMKAGKVSSGEFSVEKALKDGHAFLVIAAADASDNTKKHFRDMAAYRDVPFHIYADKDSLGSCIGKQERSSIAVTDRGFAERLNAKLAGGK